MSEKEHDNCHLSDKDKERNISHEVADWATKFRLSMVALSALAYLRLDKLNVPKDTHTLLKTPLGYEIQQITGKHYLHFGAEKDIISALKWFSGCLREVQGR